jgi:hypothetical protein
MSCILLRLDWTANRLDPYLSVLEELVHAGHKFLMEIDNNCGLVADNTQGNLGEQPKLDPIHLLVVIIDIILITY